MDDLARCYNARVNRESVPPPPSDVDMIDYAFFEGQYLQSADFEET